jgi:F-type H+-transporting ATPase subunit b
MELVTPQIGLIFWTSLSFLILMFILKKFAWSPILGAVKEREASIREALESADNARLEMANLQADNERILKEARIERDAMLKEARAMKENIVSEAKNKANAEADKLVAAAKVIIESEKNAAISELKDSVSALSIEIAEKVLRAELADSDKQKAYTEELLKDVKLN